MLEEGGAPGEGGVLADGGVLTGDSLPEGARPGRASRRHHERMDDSGAALISWDDFAKVDVRVGRIVGVSDFPEARRPAWKLRIDFGPEIGVKRSSAQITNYSRSELEGRLVLAVVNFPSRQIGPFVSEVLTLGTYRDTTVLLVDPAPDARPGDRLG